MLFREIRNGSAMLFVCERYAPAIKTAGIKRYSLINLIGFKKLTIGASTNEFATLTSRGRFRFGCGLLGNVRRWRLEGVGRILRKLSSLVSELSVDFERFGYAYNVGMLSLGRNNWSSKRLLWLLSARAPPLANARVEILDDYLECYTSEIPRFEISV